MNNIPTILILCAFTTPQKQCAELQSFGAKTHVTFWDNLSSSVCIFSFPVPSFITHIKLEEFTCKCSINSLFFGRVKQFETHTFSQAKNNLELVFFLCECALELVYRNWLVICSYDFQVIRGAPHLFSA